MDDKQSRFIFQDYSYNRETAELRFSYQVSHNGEVFDFVEKLELPKPISHVSDEVIRPFLQSLFLMLGISYWKTFCPKEIIIAPFTLSKDQAAFWNTVYTKGLGEFFYKNNIDFRDLIHFPYSETKEEDTLTSFPRKDRSLLPVGGGKDAIVAAELLKKLDKDFSVIKIYTGENGTLAQESVSEKIGKESLIVRRTFDPLLFELNKRKDVLNGHVPMVAMHLFICLLVACLYDYTHIVLANEESANYGNVEYLGETMNHQWSKSFEFEKLFQEYVKKYVTEDIFYFSLLRAFSEIKIAQLFSNYPQYFSSFVSCNKGYAISKSGKTYWCGECPKCAFVFALLAAYLPKATVVGIFQKNLFEDEKLLPLYKELLGLEEFKPFECVGTPEEVIYGFYLAHQKKEWDNTPIMQFFIKHVIPMVKDWKIVEKKLFSLHDNRVPEELKEALTV